MPSKRSVLQSLATITIFVLAFGVAGCQPPPELEPGPDELLYFEPIGLGHYGSSRDTLEVVLRTEEAFLEAIEQVQLLGELPEIDFSQTMVGILAVPTNSGGFVVEVQSVEKTDGVITLNYLFSTPAEDCITIQALGLPFQVVLIRQSEGDVKYVRETRRYSCGL